mmetsp:Transcript_14926/g.23422  ORF Transcript_14926/g.23422 Transcript_14926/m.23422 type:complete len:142 (+) Transcript_14926:3-428(+)
MLSAVSGKRLNENTKIYDLPGNPEDITQYSSSDALFVPSEDIPTGDSEDAALDSSLGDAPILVGETRINIACYRYSRSECRENFRSCTWMLRDQECVPVHKSRGVHCRDLRRRQCENERGCRWEKIRGGSKGCERDFLQVE